MNINAINTPMTMKKALLSILFISLVQTFAFSQVLYSSTTYTSRFNPGLGSQGTPIVAYDDVSIPAMASDGSDSVSITKINVGIRREPNAPATNVNIYYTAFQNDSAGNNTSAAHVFLGKISLPVNGASLATSVISLGDSVTALFKIKAATGTNNQKFLIGASFDNPSKANGIILSKEAYDNLDEIWIDNTDNDKAAYATNFNGRLPAAYYLQVFGGSDNELAARHQHKAADVAVNTVGRSVAK